MDRGNPGARAVSRFRLFDLNPEQYRAATHEAGPMLILAGAGTGKTRVITARVAWLAAQGVPPERILAVTFTNKAAREMRGRIAGMVGAESGGKVWTSTFHSLCVRILRADAALLGYKPSFSIFDEGDQSGLIKKIINRTAAKDEKLDPAAARAAISRAKNNGWAPPADEESLIGAVYARYERELKAQNAMDFDDLLRLAVRLLADHEAVRERWRGRFDHLLVDEFQDTNRLQLELVGLLARGSRPNICVVGDDDQSIYGWRGAEISNILEFERHFPGPEIFKLEQNYRSTGTILDAANRLIRHNARRRGKKLWSAEPGGEDVQVVAVPHEKQEAEFVAGEIAAQRDTEGLPWESFAVLFRMNAQSRLIEGELRRLGIPYRVVGGRSFFDRREVKDILAYMSVLVNSEDDQALLRIIATPPRGIGAGTIEMALEESARAGVGLQEVLLSPGFLENSSRRTAGAVRDFADQLQALRIQALTPGADCAGLLSRYLTECGYFDDLKRSCKTPEEALSRETNAREILGALADSQKKSGGGLRGFLDEVSLDREREEDKDESNRGVTLITLHAAKGLEFPHVYLIGAEDGVLPHERSKADGQLDEERRLLYVGITRARRTLVITHCRERSRFGSPMHCRRSPFLDEIRGEGVEESTYEEIMSRPVSEETAASQFERMRQMLAGG